MAMNRKEFELLERISMNPDPSNGKPVIRGTTVTVEEILGLMGKDISIPGILRQNPHLSDEDIRACLLFAQKVMEDISFMPFC